MLDSTVTATEVIRGYKDANRALFGLFSTFPFQRSQPSRPSLKGCFQSLTAEDTKPVLEVWLQIFLVPSGNRRRNFPSRHLTKGKTTLNPSRRHLACPGSLSRNFLFLVGTRGEISFRDTYPNDYSQPLLQETRTSMSIFTLRSLVLLAGTSGENSL